MSDNRECAPSLSRWVAIPGDIWVVPADKKMSYQKEDRPVMSSTVAFVSSCVEAVSLSRRLISDTADVFLAA